MGGKWCLIAFDTKKSVLHFAGIDYKFATTVRIHVFPFLVLDRSPAWQYRMQFVHTPPDPVKIGFRLSYKKGPEPSGGSHDEYRGEKNVDSFHWGKRNIQFECSLNTNIH